MKRKVLAIVSRNKLTNEVLDFEMIPDLFTEVLVYYPLSLVSKQEFMNYLKSKTHKDIPINIEKFYSKDKIDYKLCDSAVHLPSLGNVIVAIENKEMEWN
jgi:hypothetical protein